MKAILRQRTYGVYASVMLLFLFSIILPSLSGAGTLNIGIIGDQTGTYDLDSAYKALKKGIDILKGQHVQMALHVGDLIESTKSDEACVKDYRRATALLDTLGVPWYLTPGDHDVNPLSWEQGSDDRSKEALFRKLYAEKVPEVTKHMYYSFDFKGYHFIALYSHETLRVDPRWGNIFMAKVSDAQYQWLKQDLEKSKADAGIIVFIHQPLWYNWSGWLRVHQLLSRYPVRAVIAGHYHYDQDEGMIDGIRYVIVGATGGSVKNASHATMPEMSGK